MRKFIIIILLTTFTTTIAQKDGVELGIRYAKLANTYRVVGDYELAKSFLDDAYNLLNKKSSYWTGVCHENYALLYQDLADFEKNIEEKNYYNNLADYHLKNAEEFYDASVKMKKGSQDAVKKLATIDKKLIGNLKKLPTSDEQVADINEKEKIEKVDINKAKKELFEQVSIDLSGNKLKILPSNLPSNLKRVNLSHNKLQNYSGAFSGVNSLEYLDLSNNKIANIEVSAELALSLKFLDLSNNKIKTIPDNISSYKALKILSLSNNKLKSIPASLCLMQNLEVLKLRGNKIPYNEIKKLLSCLPNTIIDIEGYKLIENEELSEDEDTFVPEAVESDEEF